MSKKLVAYFSASGVTARVARKLAAAVGADLHEIQPERPYTPADLDWTDQRSRSSLEMKNKAQRPAVANRADGMEGYDVIYVGFPIWWYVAPTIINTFLESYNLEGKVLVPFATSGGSGMGNTNDELKNSCKGAVLKTGKRFDANVKEAELKAWSDGLQI